MIGRPTAMVPGDAQEPPPGDSGPTRNPVDADRPADPPCGHATPPPGPATLPEVLRVPHLVDLLGLSPSAVRELLARGDLPGSKVGKRWVVRREALLAHLEAQERARRAPPTRVPTSRRRTTQRDLDRLVRAARE